MRPISSASEMNSAGGDLAARRVVPAQQGLETADPVLLQIEDRLIVDLELAVAAECVAQIKLQRAAHLQTHVHLGLEEPPVARPSALAR